MTWVKVGGVWERLTTIWEKVAGTWQDNVISYIKVDGVWKRCMPPNPVHDVLTDLDGNEYGVIEINNQEWITENLRVTKYADSTSIPNLTDNSAWSAEDGTTGHNGSYRWYNNDMATYTDYGPLYNWYATNNSKGLVYFTRGGVHETGWRLPTNDDFTNLQTFIYPNCTAKLKEVGLDHWLTPNYGATDKYGFKALPGGYCNLYGGFNWIRENGSIWTSTEYDSTNVYYRTIGIYNFAECYSSAIAHKRYGYSVRCVRDIV